MIRFEKNIIRFPDEIKIANIIEEQGTHFKDNVEINNVMITYQRIQDVVEYTYQKDKYVKDIEERKWLFNKIDNAIEEIKNNPHTRKAVFYNLYESGFTYNCLNVFHLYYREKRLNMNVYVRSMDFIKNFNFDLFTFSKLLDKACDALTIERGNINVHIMSLHTYK